MAQRAKDALNALLARGRRSGTLEIRYQRRRDGGYATDRYGRRLAWVKVRGVDVGETLITMGLAHEMDWDAGQRRIRDYWCKSQP